MSGTAFLLMSCGTLLGILGDVFLKQADSLSKRFWLGMLSYACCAFPLWKMYRLASWLTVTIAWPAVSISVSLLVGVFFFKESLTFRQLAALSLAIGAICLSLGGE